MLLNNPGWRLLKQLNMKLSLEPPSKQSRDSHTRNLTALSTGRNPHRLPVAGTLTKLLLGPARIRPPAALSVSCPCWKGTAPLLLGGWEPQTDQHGTEGRSLSQGRTQSAGPFVPRAAQPLCSSSVGTISLLSPLPLP